MQSSFEFLVSEINYYHINGLHLFWDSFECFCLQISSEANYFSSLVRGIVIKDYTCDRILNLNLKLKEHNTISSRFINSHMCPMYIEIPNIINSRFIGSQMDTMYIETPYTMFFFFYVWSILVKCLLLRLFLQNIFQLIVSPMNTPLWISNKLFL